MRVEILPSAYSDLAAGRDFYDRSGSEVGEHFVRTLLADIATLAITGGSHRKVRRFHRLISKRFPYAVYYLVRDDRVEVARVLDCRFDPRRITAELRRTP